MGIIPILGKKHFTRKKNNLNYSDLYLSIIIIFFISFLSIIIYYSVGSPGLQEMPISKRIKEIKEENIFPSQISIENQTLNLNFSEDQKNIYNMILKLREKIDDSDTNGHQIIVKNSISIGDFKTARVSQEKILKYASNKEIYFELLRFVEISVLAADGIISRESKTAIEQLNNIDPESFESIYYNAMVFAQQYEKLKALKLLVKLSENLNDKDIKKKLIFNQISKLYTY